MSVTPQLPWRAVARLGGRHHVGVAVVEARLPRLVLPKERGGPTAGDAALPSEARRQLAVDAFEQDRGVLDWRRRGRGRLLGGSEAECEEQRDANSAENDTDRNKTNLRLCVC